MFFNCSQQLKMCVLSLNILFAAVPSSLFKQSVGLKNRVIVKTNKRCDNIMIMSKSLSTKYVEELTVGDYM